MNAVDRYIHEVMNHITASPVEKARIESDLRAHMQEALDAGVSPEEAVKRMGNPREIAAGFMSQMKLELAGFWLRLLAFLIDMLVVFLAASFFAVSAILLSNLVPRHPAGGGYLGGAILILLVAGFALAALGIILAYFPLLEGRFGYTLGKHLLGLHVLTEEKLPVGYKEAILRRLSYYFEMLPVDALFIPFTQKKQRAFDIVARTIVVKKDSYKG
jgi:uncharacterized RDD family membrane protein YckC